MSFQACYDADTINKKRLELECCFMAVVLLTMPECGVLSSKVISSAC